MNGIRFHFLVLWEIVESRKEEKFWREAISQQGYQSPSKPTREILDWSQWFLENVPHRELDPELSE